MRVLVLGGSKFIGRRIVEDLVVRGDDVLIVHRGDTEPADLVACEHLHADRNDFARVAPDVRAFAPDAVVDTIALTRADTEAVVPHLPDVPTVVLSSVDVYEAYDVLRFGGTMHGVPLDEDSPVRAKRYPYRGMNMVSDDYEKLDVEPVYLARGASVLRLGFVYGEHDPQRREEFVLRRVRAGRARLPFGGGEWIGSRVYVGDVASAVLAALATERARGEVLNVVETRSPSIRGWAQEILAAAGAEAELVRVPDATLPGDLELTGVQHQHMLASNAKARALLDWAPRDPADTVPISVRWHLMHPPEQPDALTADEEALAAAT